MSIIHQNSLYI